VSCAFRAPLTKFTNVLKESGNRHLQSNGKILSVDIEGTARNESWKERKLWITG
jgi:hypothetical protein